LDEHFWREHTYFLDVVAPVIAHHPDRLIGLHLSRYHPHVTDDAAINVEYRIEHERAQGCVGRFFRRRNPVDDRLPYFIDSDSHLRARIHRFLGPNRQNLLPLPMDRRNVRVWQINLLDYWPDREA